MSARLIFIFAIILFIGHFPLMAQTDNTIYLQGDTSISTFDAQVKFFVDSAKIYDESNLASADFIEEFSKTFSREAIKGGNIWARFFVKHTGSKQARYVFETNGELYVNVFYRKVGDRSFSIKKSGKLLPFPENEMANRFFKTNKVRLDFEPQSTYEIIINYPIQPNERIKPAFSVYSINNWEFKSTAFNASRNFWIGLFFGICMVLCIVNFIYYFIHKDSSYLIYAIYIVSLIYYEASVYELINFGFLKSNLSYYYFFENITHTISIIFYLLFLKSFLSTKTRFPFWNKISNALIITLMVDIIVSFIVSVYFEIPVTAAFIRNIIILMILPFAAFFLYNIFIKGNKIDHIFLAGSAILVISGLVGLISHMVFYYPKSDLLFQVGVLIELIIFNIGLSVKARFHEREKISTQLQLIDQLKENERLQASINEDLEHKVMERTSEISAQNEELLQQQEELASQRDSLEAQNQVIAQGMLELESIKSQLELIVDERTIQLKNANRELVQHNNQLEQYAYITAHNLRAPVARLKGLVYILEKIDGINTGNEEVVHKIINSALEMDEVLTDMNSILEIKNFHNGQKKLVEIAWVVEKVKRILSDSITESNAQITIHPAAKMVSVFEPYLESIIYNLVSNAIKYRSENRPLEIDISSSKEKNEVLLVISDNGIGIDLPKYSDKLFGLYQRFHDHTGGKGLGLYLVKTQVESLGGSIEVSSKIDSGTTFKIILPA